MPPKADIQAERSVVLTARRSKNISRSSGCPSRLSGRAGEAQGKPPPSKMMVQSYSSPAHLSLADGIKMQKQCCAMDVQWVLASGLMFSRLADRCNFIHRCEIANDLHKSYRTDGHHQNWQHRFKNWIPDEPCRFSPSWYAGDHQTDADDYQRDPD